MAYLRDTIYVTNNNKEMGDVFPMSLLTEDYDELALNGGYSCANACDYHFDIIDGIHYFVLSFEALEFCFDKYYAMDTGYNDELWNTLLEARAVRLSDGKVDFEALLIYVFDIEIVPINDGKSFLVRNVHIQQDSYEANVDGLCERNSALVAAIEEHKYDYIKAKPIEAYL